MVFEFIQSVISLGLRWPISVTSWGRTEKHNRDLVRDQTTEYSLDLSSPKNMVKEVGGHSQSWHLLWLAVDVVLDNMQKNPDFEADCKLLGITPIFEGDCYHLQPAGISR